MMQGAGRPVTAMAKAGVIVAAAFLTGSGAVHAANAEPTAAIFQAIAPGEWLLHEIGEQGPGRALCIADPRLLFQIVHGNAACTRTVLADAPRAATIRYACPGTGYGVTRATVESATIVRLQTQGLLRGAPFDRDVEARRQGPCRQR